MTFRPGPELDQLAAGFAAGRGVTSNEVFKNLAALAAAGMDVRYYDLLAEMAARVAGANAFVRAALHVRAALLGATAADGRMRAERERAGLVIGVVRDHAAATGGPPPDEVAGRLVVELGLAAATPPRGGAEPDESESAGADAKKREAERVRVGAG